MSQSFRDVLAKDGINLVCSDEFGSGIGRPQKNNFAPRVDFAWTPYHKLVVRGGTLFYGAFEKRGNPSLGYNYPFQFTLGYNRINDVTPCAIPTARSRRSATASPASRPITRRGERPS